MVIYTKLLTDENQSIKAGLYARFANEEALISSASEKQQNRKRTALYSRTASRHPDDAFAIENQKEKLRDFAEQMGFEDFMEYADNGFSGLDLDRPAFKQMEADIKAGVIDRVIMRSIDRVARDFILAGNWLNGLEEQGVEFITLDGLLYPAAPLRNLIFKALTRPTTA